MVRNLENKKVAILIADGFEESEFTQPLEALKNAGAQAEIISLKRGKVKAWSKKEWGREYTIDKAIEEVNSHDYDALVLPGGVMNSDLLRQNKKVVKFVSGFFDDRKPIAAICHAPWTLIETEELDGRKMTSYPSLKTDLINAGVEWVDEEVVVDNGLVTSQNPNDLPAFCKKMIEEFAERIHAVSLK